MVQLKIIRINFDDIWLKCSYDSRIKIQILSSLLNGAMLTGSVVRNFQNSRYFQWPVWRTKSW